MELCHTSRVGQHSVASRRAGTDDRSTISGPPLMLWERAGEVGGFRPHRATLSIALQAWAADTGGPVDGLYQRHQETRVRRPVPPVSETGSGGAPAPITEYGSRTIDLLVVPARAHCAMAPKE